MTPDFCKTCEIRIQKGGRCTRYNHCPKWQQWFRREWARIRKAAETIKKSTKEESAE